MLIFSWTFILSGAKRPKPFNNAAGSWKRPSSRFKRKRLKLFWLSDEQVKFQNSKHNCQTRTKEAKSQKASIERLRLGFVICLDFVFWRLRFEGQLVFTINPRMDPLPGP